MEDKEGKKNLNDDESIFRGSDNYSGDDGLEDFADFGEDDMTPPTIDEDLIEKEEEVQEEPQKEVEEEPKEEIQEVSTEEIQEVCPMVKESPKEDISKWEELDKDNAVVKKYIVYVAKDFVPQLDSLTTDERSAYINDAIQKKIDIENNKKEENKKKRLLLHIIIIVITFCVLTPFALLLMNKAIMVTFDNYKYSQDNFEKLYKARFEKDKAYMRSIKWNREHKIKN